MVFVQTMTNGNYARYRFANRDLGVDMEAEREGEAVDGEQVREDFLGMLTVAMEQSDYEVVIGESHIAKRIEQETSDPTPDDDAGKEQSDTDGLPEDVQGAIEAEKPDYDPFRRVYELDKMDEEKDREWER